MLSSLRSRAAALAQDPSGSDACKNHFILESPCTTDDVGSFRIRQLYSSQDGRYQFIELEETAGEPDARHFAGKHLVATNRYGITKTFVFPSNLPGPDTAGKHVLIATETAQLDVLDWLGYLSAQTIDYVIPDRFLPADGGVLSLSEADEWSFERLPHDGVRSLYRDGRKER